MKTLYHGSAEPFAADSNRCLYATPNIEEAREYALGLNDLGEYNPQSYIYALEIDETQAVEIEDFAEFDSLGYDAHDDMPEIAHNNESGYFCIKHPSGLRLVESFTNEL